MRVGGCQSYFHIWALPMVDISEQVSSSADEAVKQPVLVVGEPMFCIALYPFAKVRGRLGGDVSDNIPFYYAGFRQRVDNGLPGDDALYV